MTQKDTVSHLRETIYKKIAPLITGDYVLWGLPYYPNIGDTLIWEGELEFLKRIPHRCVGTCAWDDYSVRPLKKDTVILITGGGYFGDVWRMAWDNVMDTITRYPENRIIILPNTIYYGNPETMKEDSARLAALKRLVICTRDSVSYGIAKENFSNEVLLVPDMAFCISDRTLDRWRKTASDKTLLLMRTDKELGGGANQLQGGPGIDTRDWPTMKCGKPRFADRVFGRAHRMRKEARQNGSAAAPAAAWLEKAVAYLMYRPHLTGTGIEFISMYGTIVTTRLHAMILGLLLGKEVRYIDNSYGKLSSFYGTWLTGCDGVEKFAGDNAGRDVKISVIVPVYDVEPYIADCLRSVMGQTYGGPMECLVVDDCGHDGSMAEAEKVIAAYKGPVEFRILHHERNKGLSAARNTGLRAATGDYVYFLDSDDEITPDCMEMLAAPLRSGKYDFVIGGYRVTGTMRKVPPLSMKDGSSIYGSGIIRTYYDRRWYMMACGKLCSLKFLRDNGLMMKEGLLHEDELWSFQMACTAGAMHVVNRDSYIYKVRENSITTNSFTGERRVRALHDIIRGMTDFVMERGIRDRYAYLKIFNTLNVLWNATRDHQDLDGIALDGRRELARLPYRRRLTACMAGPRKFIRDAYAVLPVCLYRSYNRAVTSRKKG